MRVAVIPARGGSQRIPRKNIKLFHGKPMIAWSIYAALRSQCFDKIIVSTEDVEIAQIAKSLGAEVPFQRPKHLADDFMGTTPVVAHALNWLIEHNQKPSEACCIYATAPFLEATDITHGLSILLNNGADFAFAVTTYPFPVQRAIRINSKNRIEMLNPDNFNIRSQDLEEVWHDAGQFYWGTTDAWLSSKIMFSDVSSPIFIPRSRVQDIDTIEDWDRAELMFKSFQYFSS